MLPTMMKALGIGEETVFNTAVVASMWLPCKKTVDLEPEIQTLKTDHLRQKAVTQEEEVAQGIRSWKGKSSSAILTEGPALTTLLKHHFGKVVTAASGGGSNYDHTFTPNAGQFPGLTLIVKQGADNQIVGSGGRVVGVKLACTVGQFMLADLDYEGGSYAEEASAGTVSLPTVKEYYLFRDAELKVGGTAYGVSGFELDLKRTVAGGEAESYELGSGERAALDQTDMEISGVIKRRYALDGASNVYTSLFQELFGAFTTTELILTVTGSEIGSSGEYFTVTATVQAKLGKPKRSDAGGVILEEVPFTCVETSTADALSLVMRDSVSTPASATGDYA